MRASAIKDDPGFINCSKVKSVLFNNELVGQGRVVTADEEAGMLEIYKLDVNGAKILDQKSGCYVTIILKGQVEIVTTLH